VEFLHAIPSRISTCTCNLHTASCRMILSIISVALTDQQDAITIQNVVLFVVFISRPDFVNV